MTAALAIPLVRGVRHGFSSIELKMNGLLFVGFKSINYSRTRTRSQVRGNSPDPIAKTRGENDYKCDCEVYLAEWNLFQKQLKDGYGDVFFNILVTYGENGFDTISDEIIGCTMDTTESSNSQGPDALVRKMEFSPLKIKFDGIDDLAVPLVAPAGG